MKKNLRFWSLLAVLLVSSTAWADNGIYSGSVTQKCKSDYSTDAVTFSLSEMAGFFGVEASQFAADLQAFITADKEAYKVDDNSDKTLYVSQIVNGGESVYPNAELRYSANLGDYFCGFWMNKDGKPQNYGDEGSAWYWLIQADEEADEVQFLIGQMPNYWVDGGSPSCDLNIVYNGKTANVTLSASIAAKPVVDMETTLSKLNIVKDYTLTLNFTRGKEYEGKTYSTIVEGIYEALGLTAEELDESINDRTYTQVVRGDTVNGEVAYSFVDELKTPEEAAGGGWFGRYSVFDEETGAETFLPMNAPKDWNTGSNTFYVQNITLEADTFSIVSGQFPGVLKTGDEDFAYLYVINGANAARIKVVTEVKEPENIDPNDFVKVGEQVIEINSKVVPGYGTKSFSIDIEAVYAALECTADDIDDIYAWESDGVMTDNHTESSGGFYYNNEGYVDQWSGSATVFISLGNIPNGQYNIGQKDGVFNDITEPVTIPLSIIYKFGAKYYEIKVIYTISPDEPTDLTQSEWKRIDTFTYDVQVVPSSDYPLEQKTQVDLDRLAKTLNVENTDDLVLYGDVYYENEEAIDPDKRFTKRLTLTPQGGFWMKSVNGKLYPCDWAEADAMGMDWQNSGPGVISWWNKPNTRSVGDTYQGDFYLVDETTGHYVCLHCNIEFVETVMEVEEVGEEDVAFVLSADNLNDDGLYATQIDMSKACESLGIDISEIESATWYAQNSAGSFSVVESFEGEDCVFDATGAMAAIDSEDARFAVGYDYDNNTLVASLLGDEPTEETLYTTRIALRNGSKRYIFNITLGSEDALSIDNVKMTSKNTQFFDLSGRAVKNPTKGFYIANGTKMLVK